MSDNDTDISQLTIPYLSRGSVELSFQNIIGAVCLFVKISYINQNSYINVLFFSFFKSLQINKSFQNVILGHPETNSCKN